MLQMVNWPPLGLRLVLHAAVLLLAILPAGALKTETHSFGLPFDPTNDTQFFSFSVGSITHGALQVTPDSAQPNFTLNNYTGRILYNKPFTLWGGDPSSNTTRIASFNTTFIINIAQVRTADIGEGMAFLITPDLSNPPAGSDGEYLGLTNSSTDGNATNHLFAIEFDTHKQEFDQDDNHIGIDINSIRSIKNVSLSKSGIILAPNGTVIYNKIWIQYDGINRNLSVYIANLNNTSETVSMPESPALTMEGLDLSSIVEQESYFGFAASTGSKTEELNCVLSWNITVEVIRGGGGGWWRGATIAAAAVVAVVMAGGAWLWRWRRRRRRAEMAEEEKMFWALKSLPGTPREFEFRVLKTATGNFDEKNRLGEGGYGVVFRGVLPEENVEVAVKKFTREDNIRGKEDFLSELTIINRLRHKHLVKLLGWCHKNKMLLLVYEYMPNCSLDRHIFCEDQAPLSWNFRYKILSGVASALQYLHHEYDETVIHRDIKASNIMLDANFNARLGDFGLARALEQEKTSYAEMGGFHGTMGYIAPECFHTEKATRESDVYAFGVVLLEVATGHRPWDKLGGFNCLGDWVWSLHRETRIMEAVDSRLGNDYVVEEAERVLLLGLACLHPIASERPNTQAIVQILSGSVPVPSVPPFKPAFVWPSMGPMMALDISIDTNTTTYTTHIASSRSGNEWTTSSRSPESIDGLIDHSSV